MGHTQGIEWNEGRIADAIKELRRCANIGEALTAIGKVVDERVTRDSLRKAFLRFKKGSPYAYLLKRPNAPTESSDEEMKRFIDVIKKGPIAFADICDKLDMAPSKAKAVIKR